MNNKSLGKLKKKMVGEGGRGGLPVSVSLLGVNTEIAPAFAMSISSFLKTLNDALHGTSYALHVTHVRNKHEHIRTRNGGYYQISHLIEGVAGASHYRDQRAYCSAVSRPSPREAP